MTADPMLLDAVERFLAAPADRSPDGPLLVASDFDGVLAPLVDDPSASRMTEAAAGALARLAALPESVVRVALVSGRDLDALAHLASPPPGTVLIGSHGAERGDVRSAGDGTTVDRRPLALTPEQAELLERVEEGLESVAAPLEGAWVEHKPSAAVLHTRLAGQRERAEESARASAAMGERLGAHVTRGKDVVEIAVVETSKGQALDALRTELAARRVFYMGDDVTDERAFAVLGDDDLAVKVGEGQTLAPVRIADPQAAAELLVLVADRLTERARS